LVEFALVAPVLLLLLIGIFDVARILNAYVTVSHASREGAHYASLHPTSSESDVYVNAIAPNGALNVATDALTVNVRYYDMAAAASSPSCASVQAECACSTGIRP
jgi:Flp pilus assembly protein TadG